MNGIQKNMIRNFKKWVYGLSLLSLVVAHMPSAQALSFLEPYSLDYSFGVDGRVITGLESRVESGRDVLVLSDGKILVAGQSSLYDSVTRRNNHDLLFVRYLKDGSLDPSFGNQGTVLVDLGSDQDDISDIWEEPDGNIFVAARSYLDSALVRLKSDGSRDKSFGTNGIQMIKYAYPDGAVRLQDGKYLMAAMYVGQNNIITGNIIIGNLARFNSNGSPDSSFGINGYRHLSFTGFHIHSLILQPDGKVLVGGTRYNIFGYKPAEFAVTRLDGDGNVDTTFGNQGLFSHPIGDDSVGINRLLLQEDGQILAAGSGDQFSTLEGRYLLVRLTAQGILDTSFADKGILISERLSSPMSHGAHNQAIAINHFGDILIGSKSPENIFAMEMYDSHGQLTPWLEGRQNYWEEKMVKDGFCEGIQDLTYSAEDDTFIAVGGANTISSDPVLPPTAPQIDIVMGRFTRDFFSRVVKEETEPVLPTGPIVEESPAPPVIVDILLNPKQGPGGHGTTPKKVDDNGSVGGGCSLSSEGGSRSSGLSLVLLGFSIGGVFWFRRAHGALGGCRE